jgi:ankyrin repeat protein
MFASQNGDSEFAKFLIDNNADLNLSAPFSDIDIIDSKLTALQLSLLVQNSEIARLLLESGANIGDVNDANSPLKLAIRLQYKNH